MERLRSDSGVPFLPPKCKAKPLRVERGWLTGSTECSVSVMSAMAASGVLAKFLRGVEFLLRGRKRACLNE